MGIRSLGWEDSSGEGNAAQSGILVWEIPWTEASHVSREVTLLCRFLTSELPLALLKLVLGPPFSAQTAYMLLHKIFRKA